MAKNRYLSTSFWDDAWIQELTSIEKLVYLYLLTNPLTSIAGIYQITIRRMAFDISLPEKTILEIIEKFTVDRKAYFLFNEWIIIPNWTKHQNFNDKSNVKTGIDSILLELPNKIWENLKGVNYYYKYIEELDRDFKSLQVPPSDSNGLPISYLTLSYSTLPNLIIHEENSTPFKEIDEIFELNELPEEKTTLPEPETTQNSKKTDSNTQSKVKETRGKDTYGEFKNVLLSKEEFEKCIDKHTAVITYKAIEKLSSFKESNGKVYKSDYAALNTWVWDALNKKPSEKISDVHVDNNLKYGGFDD